MSQQNESGLKAFTASGTVARHTLVYLSAANTVAVNTIGNTSKIVGIAQNDATDGEIVTVAMLTPGRTYKAASNEALAANAVLYAAASGFVADTAVGEPIGIALEASLTTNNDVIEIIYNPSAAAYASATTNTHTTGAGAIRMSTSNGATNSGWLPLKYPGTSNTYYVPYWTTHAPAS